MLVISLRMLGFSLRFPCFSPFIRLSFAGRAVPRAARVRAARCFSPPLLLPPPAPGVGSGCAPGGACPSRPVLKPAPPAAYGVCCAATGVQQAQCVTAHIKLQGRQLTNASRALKKPKLN